MDIRHMTCGELAALCESATAGDFSVNDDFPSCATTPCMVVVDGDGMIRQWALGDDPAMVDEWQDIGDPVPWQRRYREITVIREDGERRSLEIVAKADGTVWLWDSVADPTSDSLVQLQDDSDTSVADALGPDWEICGPEIRVITVYWDDADGVWAYRTTDADGRVSRGTACVAPEASIADAIDEACYQLDVELTHDDFAIDGLCAEWTAEVPA